MILVAFEQPINNHWVVTIHMAGKRTTHRNAFSAKTSVSLLTLIILWSELFWLSESWHSNSATYEIRKSSSGLVGIPHTETAFPIQGALRRVESAERALKEFWRSIERASQSGHTLYHISSIRSRFDFKFIDNKII